MKPRGFDEAFAREQRHYENMEPPESWDDDDPDRPPTKREIDEERGEREFQRRRDGDD